MMKFTGKYTNGRETITYLECTFTGHEPREVPAEVAELLANHPEFETVGETPVKRKPGRPRKVN